MSEAVEPVIASSGKVQRVQFNMQNQGGNAAADGGEPELNEVEKANVANGLNKDGSPVAAAAGLTEVEKAANIAAGLNEDGTAKAVELTADKKAENIAAGLNEDGTPKTTVSHETAPLTDEEFKAEYEKRFPTEAALTDEQKQKAEAAFEKRMLDLYVDNGGKIEEFSLLKQVASTDLTELSKAELTKELKAAGFNETEIAAIQKERYYQLDEAELEQLEDETAKEFAKRKAEYGKNKLEGKGKMIKENAVDFLNNLKEAVNQKDFFTKKESEFSSNVDEYFSKVERKITLQLGKAGDADISPVEFEVPEDAITAARDTLKNIATRKQLLFNKDGSLNHANIGELILKANMFDSAAKTAYLEGGTRQVTEFEKRFPFRSATALGVGGSSTNLDTKGKVVSAGKPQMFRPAVNQ